MLLVGLSRVSTGEQVDGTGLQRQHDAFAAYAEARGWQLHPEVYSDEGVSGFSGANLEGDLGRFLADHRAGRFGQPVALGVEDIDRLSRQFSLAALPFVVDDLLNAGITISVIGKGRDICRESIRRNPYEIQELLLYLQQAHDFSDKLSKRISSHRDSLRKAIREGKPAAPGQAPSWVDLIDGQWQLNDYAAVIRRIIALTQDGDGCIAIAQQLNADKVPTPGQRKGRKAAPWSSESILQVLKSPALHGARRVAAPGHNERVRQWKETVAHLKRQKDNNTPLPPKPVREYEPDQEGYFPPLLTRAEHNLLLSQITQRKTSDAPTKTDLCRWIGQRRTRCACGATMTPTSASPIIGGKRQTVRYLRCTSKRDGGGCNRKMLRLDQAIPSLLTRLTSNELSNLVQASTGCPDDVAMAEQELTKATRLVTRLTAQVNAGDGAIKNETDTAVLKLLAKRQVDLQAEQAAAIAAELAIKQRLDALKQSPDLGLTAELQDLVRGLLKRFATEEDTVEERLAINGLLRQLKVKVLIDSDKDLMGLQVGEAEPDWQPMGGRMARDLLAEGQTDVVYAIDDIVVDEGDDYREVVEEFSATYPSTPDEIAANLKSKNTG